MKERNIIILLSIFFLFTGIFIATSAIYNSDFNFNKAELNINNLEIQEKLLYTADKDYHTLYRTFSSPVYTQPAKVKNYIEIKDVKCTEGTPYANDKDLNCFTFPKAELECLANTEANEYGCSFSNIYGFKKDSNYKIESTFILNPENLFLIKNNYYIKFIAYSKNQHAYLDSNNLIINGEVIKDSKYYPRDDVIIYIPFNNPSENYNIIEQKDFEFDSAFFQHLIIVLYSLIPLLLILIAWYYFGREKSYADVPSELSNVEKDRPGYEVATLFNPPFTQNPNMFAAIMLELYNKKIIDFKRFDDKVYVKIIKTTTKDKVFDKFLKLIIKVKDISKNEFIKEGYLNLKDAIEKYNNKVYNDYALFTMELSKIEGNYLEKSGLYFLVFCIIVLFTSLLSFYMFMDSLFINLIGSSFYLFILHILLFAIVIIILLRKTALFITFKKEYYAEYLHWQAFKNYLKNSFAMRESEHEAVVLWDQYLVYAAAFGIAEEVLKRLKDLKIIDEDVYTNYNTMNNFAVSSFAFTSPASKSSGSSYSSGGFSGSSSGGIGGGGGGGR